MPDLPLAVRPTHRHRWTGWGFVGPFLALVYGARFGLVSRLSGLLHVGPPGPDLGHTDH
jgi:hypothetical protein